MLSKGIRVQQPIKGWFERFRKFSFVGFGPALFIRLHAPELHDVGFRFQI
jgi:hypothetical protein